LEGPQERKYQVIITEPAEVHFYEILEYLYDNYSLEKAEHLAESLRDKTKSLQQLPHRGPTEKHLKKRGKDYRFILFKRISRSQIKIIYFVDEQEKKVLVTDFFPTESDDQNIPKRNS
jgi:plasmid stabilization system protein ParE